MAVLLAGCAGESAKPPPKKEPTPTPQPHKPRDEAKEATDAFPAFCRQVIAEQQAVFKGRKFTKQVRAFTMTYEVTISDRFTYDVKKSDSLISPVVGELWIEGRTDGMMAGQPINGEWIKQKIECSWRDGKWHHDTKAEGMFQPR